MKLERHENLKSHTSFSLNVPIICPVIIYDLILITVIIIIYKSWVGPHADLVVPHSSCSLFKDLP
jgi:hypothetical protein